MAKKKILVLGASGMLGSAVFRCLHASRAHEVSGTVRNQSVLKFFSEEEKPSIATDIDVLHMDGLISLLDKVDPDIVINCVGLIKQLSSAKDPLVALPVNALFPHRLARLCALAGVRLIHVSTDCVFTGATGNYTEEDIPDAIDLYGRSKLLGELVEYEHAVTLRTSIIGRELSTSYSLMDWFLAQTDEVKGFDRAIFSGLPTCELAAVIREHVIPRDGLSGLYHVSAAPISKFDLLRLVAAQYGNDVRIIRHSDVRIDRSLNSERFMNATGYKAPVWSELIRRMHEADLRWKN